MTGWRSSGLLPSLAIAVIAFAACLLQLSFSKSPYPAADELQYLGYGHVLAETGRYAATMAGPSADAGPGREPLYPVLVAAVMHLDPVLRQAATRCIGNTSDPTCPAVFTSLRWTNALLVALAAVLVFLAARCLLRMGRMGTGVTAIWVAGLYLALNLQMMKGARYIISDYLALACAAAFTLALALALARPRSALRWAAAGATLALLVLTKAVYELYAVPFCVGLVVWLFARRNRAALQAVCAVVLVLALALGGWGARNWSVFGRFSLTDGRGGIALSTREVFDHMTTGEYAASFFWWTRGPGPGLARALFDKSDWHRHEWEPEDGFYNQGQVVRYEARVRWLMDSRDLDRKAAEAQVSRVVIGEILDRFPMYLATMIPLIYRGLWFDEFIVFGFPAFVWLLVRAMRRRDGAWLLVLSPSLFSLLAYPALSLNIARYQIPAAPGLALAAGLAASVLIERWKQRRLSRSPAGLASQGGKGA